MTRRCKHGVLLYGTTCRTCENEHVLDAAAYHLHRWVHTNDARVRPEHMGWDTGRDQGSSYWQGTYRPNPVEIITDPDDMRGVNARRVYPINRSATL